MSNRKWGESFLKSGLPLEHLNAVTFRDLKWRVDPHHEYSRENKENEVVSFELDLVATCPTLNRSTELSFLVECKYHDLSRHWFFLPSDLDLSEPVLCRDGEAFNCGPYETLEKPYENTVLCRAPLSIGGIVVSLAGTKQKNAVDTATQQLVNAFFPYSLSRMFKSNINPQLQSREIKVPFSPRVTALIPMIVTNASLYRLRPNVTDLDEIRKAATPEDIADEVEWTWYYHDIPNRLFIKNLELLQKHSREEGRLVYALPNVDDAMLQLIMRPRWITVVNIKALSKVVTVIQDCFAKLHTIEVEEFAPPRVRRKNT